MDRVDVADCNAVDPVHIAWIGAKRLLDRHFARLEVVAPHLEGRDDLSPGLQGNLVGRADLISMPVGHDDHVYLWKIRYFDRAVRVGDERVSQDHLVAWRGEPED